MVSHFLLMVVFAACVSVVFAVLMRDDPADQLRLGARMLAGFVGAGVLLSWLMYPFPL